MIKKIDFRKFKVFENFEELNEKTVKVGDKFLIGNGLKNQLEIKETGQDVSYYKVREVKGNTVVYITEFDTLGD